MFPPPRSRSRFYGRSTNYVNVAKDALLRRIESGDDVMEVERELAAQLGTRHAVLMPQARVGIYLVLRSLTRTKKKVILSPYTIHDVINMVICAGATPVFADIDRKTCNIDTREVEQLIDSDTAAVMVTHLHGLSCDIEGVAKVCRDRKVPLLEDTSQSFSASVGGRRLGTFGKAGIYSFGMAKNVNCLYGGAVVTDDDALATELRKELAQFPLTESELLLKRAAFCLLGDVLTWPPVFKASTYWAFRYGYLHGVEALNKRVRGEDAPQIKTEIPPHYLRRITPMQARLLVPQLGEADRLSAIRIGYAKIYDEGLAGIPEIITPPLRTDGSHIYLNYAIQVEDRHALVRFLMQHNRDITVQHMGNNADYECYAPWKRDCPNARLTGKQVVLLPTYPVYGEVEVRRNVELIQHYFKVHHQHATATRTVDDAQRAVRN
ncbi:MAG: putative PLP-dependent enzyme involved in cell wall biosis [Myxococcales bacterium]|nr:putative PLP-dependent enzyme involved in cell wall biosis [Myxococcales bacterium]